jgi:hypothetical protein
VAGRAAGGGEGAVRGGLKGRVGKR